VVTEPAAGEGVVDLAVSLSSIVQQGHQSHPLRPRQLSRSRRLQLRREERGSGRAGLVHSKTSLAAGSVRYAERTSLLRAAGSAPPALW
jgi:hypothetical protein